MDETKANSKHALDNSQKTPLRTRSSSQLPPGLDDKPTMRLFIKFPDGKDGFIRIRDKIGIKYSDYGIFLLDDDTGSRVATIKSKHLGDPKPIIEEITREWLEGSGEKPVTWRTLVRVLREIELETLADEIETSCNGLSRDQSDTSSLSQGGAGEAVDGVVGLKRKSPEHEAATGLESPSQKVKIDTDLVKVCELRSRLNALESRKKELKSTAVEEVSQLASYPGCLPCSAPGYEAISQLPNVAKKTTASSKPKVDQQEFRLLRNSKEKFESLKELLQEEGVPLIAEDEEENDSALLKRKEPHVGVRITPKEKFNLKEKEILKNLDLSSCEERIDEINKKLEKYKEQLRQQFPEGKKLSCELGTVCVYVSGKQTVLLNIPVWNKLSNELKEKAYFIIYK